MTHKSTKIGYWLDFKNGRSSPVRSDDGQFPVYGSNGLIGRCSKSNVKRSATVIGRVGSYCGSTYYSPSAAWVTDNAIIATSKNQEEDRFWFYVLKHLNLNNWRQGSGQPLLNQNILKNITFDAPKDDSRLAIAATLGALDDKIESNKVLIDKSKELIHTYCLRAQNEKQATECPVAELGDFINGGAFTKGATGTGRVVIRIAELNSGIGSSTVYNDLDVPMNKTAFFGDILMPWSGSLGVYIWTGDEAIINQHIFKVVPRSLPKWFVYDRLERVIPVFQSIASDKATTMGHIRRAHLKQITVPIFDSEEIIHLDKICSPLWEIMLICYQENQNLASLRDALLPELMAGRIRVPEAREVVQEATDIPLPEGKND